MAEQESFQAYAEDVLAIAKGAIEVGLDGNAPWPLATSPVRSLPEPLLRHRATFVTLHSGGLLRGCMGGLEACRPLAEDVARHAYAAAFADPRFSPLTREEFSQIDIHVSVLSPLEEMLVGSEDELLAELQPGRDGLLLREGYRQATFLPSVWDEIADPALFVQHLKSKAGWHPDFWSPRMRVFRYFAESIPA